MTDEKFEQILKQALTPQNYDSELKIRKRVRMHDMKKLTKKAIAVAACAVVCLSGYYTLGHFNVENKNGELDVSYKNESDAFVVKVYAAELTADNSIPIKISEDMPIGYVMGAAETKDSMYYCINLPLSCEGENIKKITYSINKGCFQIVEPADSTYLIDYAEHIGDDINFGQCGGHDSEQLDASSSSEDKVLYLDSFTVDYCKQRGDDFWINIGNVVPNMQEVINLMWYSDGSPENHEKAENMLLSDVEITVTITFEDGTQSAKVIGLESKVVDAEQMDVEVKDGTERIAVITLKEL